MRHPAAMSVVARKMLKRVQDDTAWLAAQAAAEAQRPRLRGFGSASAAHLDEGAAAAVVERVLQALDSLYTADSAAIEESIPRLLATATEGSASASEAHRRARALAMRAGCEHARPNPNPTPNRTSR